MLAVRDAEDDKVQALGAGADDYITKPFRLREPIARMGAVLRRIGAAALQTLRAVWGPEYGSEPDYLRSYVKTLRKKIENDPARPEYILTEPWVGYRLRDPNNLDSSAPILIPTQTTMNCELRRAVNLAT